MERNTRFTVSAIATILLGTLIVVFVVLLAMRSQESPRVASSDIPLPFGTESTTLRGQLSQVGTSNENYPLVDMTFDKGETAETFGTHHLTFVVTPEDPSTFSSGAPLAVALTPGTKFYGYQYTSGDAKVERDMRDLKDSEPTDGAGNPIAYTYSELFPGTFFASDDDLADEASFPSDFAAKQGVTFHPLSDLTLDANSRYLIIAETPVAPGSPISDTTLTVRGLHWCVAGDCGRGKGLSVVQGQQQRAHQYLIMSQGTGLNEPLLKLLFTARGEDVRIQNIRFSATGSVGAVDSLSGFELRRSSDIPQFLGMAVPGPACGRDSFCALLGTGTGGVLVESGKTITMDVLPRITGGTSGRQFRLFMRNDTPNQEFQAAVDAIAGTPAVALLKNNGDAVLENEVFIGTQVPGPSKVISSTVEDLTEAKVTSITNVTNAIDGAFMESGVMPIAKVKIASSSHWNSQAPYGIDIRVLRFRLAYDNVTFAPSIPADGGMTTAFQLYNAASPHRRPCTLQGDLLTCSNISTDPALDTFSGEITPNGDATFVLEADIDNPKLDPTKPAYLQASLEDLNSDSVITPAVVWHPFSATYVGAYLWSDIAQNTVLFPRFQR